MCFQSILLYLPRHILYLQNTDSKETKHICSYFVTQPTGITKLLIKGGTELQKGERVWKTTFCHVFLPVPSPLKIKHKLILVFRLYLKGTTSKPFYCHHSLHSNIPDSRDSSHKEKTGDVLKHSFSAPPIRCCS